MEGAGAVEQLYVNISPRQLADPELPQHVRNALHSAGLPPERLCLEITESILIGHQATVDAAVSYLRALGVKIGLDEFGTGQSVARLPQTVPARLREDRPSPHRWSRS